MCFSPLHYFHQSLIAYFVLPDYPQNTKWLTVEERTLATKRLLVDAAASGKFEKRLNHKEAFMMAVKDWKTWVLTVGYMCIAGAGKSIASNQMLSHFVADSLIPIFAPRRHHFLLHPDHRHPAGLRGHASSAVQRDSLRMRLCRLALRQLLL